MADKTVYEARDLTTISYRKRELVMYPVQKHEFDILAAGYSSVHLALFGIFFGVAATTGITLATVNMPDQVATRFWCALFIFAALSLYCCLMAIRDYRNSRKVLSTIKTETVDVVITDESVRHKGSSPEPSQSAASG